jgi:cell volume regulation protein A
MNPYVLIVFISSLLILSYFYNLLAKKTNIPSVLMLILTGLIIQYFIKDDPIGSYNFFPILELVGIVGLIMIVLEAALELELRKDKLGLIFKSLGVAFFTLAIASAGIGYIIHVLFDTIYLTGLLYAIPIATMSSAIVIPSVNNLDEKKREFMIYESTFSDIIGILFFYLLIEVKQGDTFGSFVLHGVGNISLTIVLSVVLSLLLIFLSQKIQKKVRLVLLLSILFILYTVGKMSHLSALFIILIFGLILQNNRFITRGKLGQFYDKKAIGTVLDDMTIITIESSFVVRTLFFVLFGLTISVTAFYNIKVIGISLLFLAILYGVRFITIYIFEGKKVFPQLFIAPRGLITILLFFAIPYKFQIADFPPGILMFVILLSSFIMGYALIRDSRMRKKVLESEGEEQPEQADEEVTEHTEETPDEQIQEDTELLLEENVPEDLNVDKDSWEKDEENTEDESTDKEDGENNRKNRFGDADWIWEEKE